MDLKRMSREALNAEGRKIGIWMPARLSRTALERKIREHHDKPLRKAGRALKKMIGIARDLRSNAPRVRMGADAPATPSVKPETATAKPTPESEPTPTASAKPTPTPKPTPTAEPTTPIAKPTPTAKPEPSPTAKQPSPSSATPVAGLHKAAAPTTPSTKPKASDDAKKKGSYDEPIETRTMAKILADQGYRRRSLAIYKKLIDASPDDEGLRAEMRGVREAKKPSDDDDDPERDECVAVRSHDHAVVAWNVGDEAVARAARLCGAGATLVLRSIVLTTADGSVERHIAEQPVELSGEQAFDIERGQRLIAAVGLRREERFVSIAHAPPLTL